MQAAFQNRHPPRSDPGIQAADVAMPDEHRVSSVTRPVAESGRPPQFYPVSTRK